MENTKNTHLKYIASRISEPKYFKNYLESEGKNRVVELLNAENFENIKDDIIHTIIQLYGDII